MFQPVSYETYGPVKWLTVSRSTQGGRLPLSKKPARMHDLKAAAALSRQISRKSASGADEAIFFGQEIIGERASLAAILPEYCRVRTGAVSLSGAISTLMGLKSSAALVVCGELKAPREESVVSLANVFDGLDFDGRKWALEQMNAELERLLLGQKDQPPCEVVLQEKPGRFSWIVLPEEQSIRGAQRRIQSEINAIMSGRDFRVSIAAEDGWGLAGVLVEEVDQKGPRSIGLAAATFRWLGDELSLDMPMKFADSIGQWFRDVSGYSLDKVERFQISAQSVALAAKLAKTLEVKERQCSFPDLSIGWMPVVSLLFGLADPIAPSLSVYCQNFPDIEVVASWR